MFSIEFFKIIFSENRENYFESYDVSRSHTPFNTVTDKSAGRNQFTLTSFNSNSNMRSWDRGLCLRQHKWRQLFFHICVFLDIERECTGSILNGFYMIVIVKFVSFRPCVIFLGLVTIYIYIYIYIIYICNRQ